MSMFLYKIKRSGKNISVYFPSISVGYRPSEISKSYKLIIIQFSYLFVLSAVILLTTGPKVRGFRPGRERWIFEGEKNP
jgi:hypothetical protein